MAITELLATLILANNSANRSLAGKKRAATVLKWAAEIVKLHRVDGMELTTIEYVIKWCQGDTFWRKQILSGEKLRMKWNRLK